VRSLSEKQQFLDVVFISEELLFFYEGIREGGLMDQTFKKVLNI